MTRGEQIAQLETEWMAQGKIASYTNWLQDQLLIMRGQAARTITVRLDENCIETIKRLTPEGGEEIPFHCVMGGVKLIWVGK